MVLVDTSIWIDHFRSSNTELRTLLLENQVFMHPLVIGELACGNLRDRLTTLSFLNSMPRPTTASDSEAHHSIESVKLYGKGIGFLDVHLLSSCKLTGCTIWTNDKALAAMADNLGLSYRG